MKKIAWHIHSDADISRVFYSYADSVKRLDPAVKISYAKREVEFEELLVKHIMIGNITDIELGCDSEVVLHGCFSASDLQKVLSRMK